MKTWDYKPLLCLYIFTCFSHFLLYPPVLEARGSAAGFGFHRPANLGGRMVKGARPGLLEGRA